MRDLDSLVRIDTQEHNLLEAGFDLCHRVFDNDVIEESILF